MMTHPALRSQPEWYSLSEISSQRSSSATATPALEYDRTLQAVPEELEGTSAQNSPMRPQEQTPNSVDLWRSSIFNSAQPPSLDSSFDSVTTSDWQSPTLPNPWKNSLSSLCSGESWEDDVNFCYLVEAESTCDFDWDSRANSDTGNEREYVLPAPPKVFFGRDNDPHNVSPRTSIANHQRAKSSMTLQLASFPQVPNSARSAEQVDWSAYSTAPVSPLPEIPSLSPLQSPWRGSYASVSDDLGLDVSNREPDDEDTLTTPRPLKSFPKTNLGHSRATSLEEVKLPISIGRHQRRWSSVIPSRLSETMKDRRISFLLSTMPLKHLSYEASRPPPDKPLPALPAQRASGLTVSSTAASELETTDDSSFIRRPSTSQDRMLLQAAGRASQSGRATPHRLSRLPNAAVLVLRDAMSRSRSTPNLKFTPSVPEVVPEMPELKSFPAWI